MQKRVRGGEGVGVSCVVYVEAGGVSEPLEWFGRLNVYDSYGFNVF